MRWSWQAVRNSRVTCRCPDGILKASISMDFLRTNSHRLQGDEIPEEKFISARGRHVVVIGGGDTGSDCIGTSTRHGAASVTSSRFAQTTGKRGQSTDLAQLAKTNCAPQSSQEEGCTRMWSVATKEFLNDGQVMSERSDASSRLEEGRGGHWKMSEIEGSEFELKADLVTLAMGFVHPVHKGMLES